MPFVRAFGLLALCLIVSALLYGGAGDGALLGFDGYPLIAASRVGSAADLFSVLGDELMGGRYPDGAFYRPLVHLSFTVNDWMGGGTLDPAPFRWTDVVIAAIAATVIGAIAARLIERLWPVPNLRVPAAVAAVIAALVFLMHRSQLDVVPYAPRRADALCVLFVAGAALEALGARRGWAIALLSLAAFFSKETGVIAVPLVALIAVLAPPLEDDAWRPRWIAVAACAGAVAVGVAVRTAVLGGLGGHAESGTAAARDGAGEIVWTLWQLLAAGVPGGAPLVLGLIAAAAIGLPPTGTTGRTTVIAAAVWALAALGITAFSGRAHMWYVVALLPSVAILAGTAVGAALALRRPAPIAAGAAALVLAGLLMGASRNGPQSEALALAGPVARDQVARFTALVTELPPGARAQLNPYVMGVAGGEGAPPVFLHASYSLQALADLLRPDLEIAVVPPGQPTPPGAMATIELIFGPPPPDVLPH
ncbi:hypothetical protein Poly30_52130 [Planctomycetes bacterium Poly30]|uniref:Glycosyltransferase RgtA/B/C/D-like domain-containing protein n=1 Tax=Saltatorellus ferox TaxID=2528018 RepID=A0A518EZZ3_9BACT|nr:hypothetical protein Poly30_52130 [Planctomycetes bacterium Poly30]